MIFLLDDNSLGGSEIESYLFVILGYLRKLAVSHFDLRKFELIIVFIIRFVLTNVPVSRFFVPFRKLCLLHLVELGLEGQTVTDLGIEPFEDLFVGVVALDWVYEHIMRVGL